MQQFSISPPNMLLSLLRSKDLLISLVKREVIGRYKGSILGIFWSFFNPIFMLLTYTFVFSIVFKARWGGASESTSEFALVLFSGLMIYNLFAECISRAPSLIVSNANYVKKVVFPLEILPVTILGSALFHFVISLAVWLIAHLMLIGVPPLTVIYLPLVLFPLLMMTIGLSWMISSLGVYLRDLSQFIGIVVTALLFLSPIFYPVSALPQSFQTIIFLNPLTTIIEQARDVLIWGNGLAWKPWALYSLASMFVAWLGFVWFQKTRKGFADVI